MNLYKFYKNPEELNGYEDRIYYVPQLAYEALINDDHRKDKDALENAVAKSAKYSVDYAWHVNRRFNKAFTEGEDTIAKDPWQSYMYAYRVLRGSFPKGENAIAKDAENSYLYAVEILKGPFLKGEEAMKKEQGVWNEYIRKFPSRK